MLKKKKKVLIHFLTMHSFCLSIVVYRSRFTACGWGQRSQIEKEMACLEYKSGVESGMSEL